MGLGYPKKNNTAEIFSTKTSAVFVFVSECVFRQKTPSV